MIISFKSIIQAVKDLFYSKLNFLSTERMVLIKKIYHNAKTDLIQKGSWKPLMRWAIQGFAMKASYAIMKAKIDGMVSFYKVGTNVLERRECRFDLFEGGGIVIKGLTVLFHCKKALVETSGELKASIRSFRIDNLAY